MDGENRPDMKGRIYTDPETYSGFIIPSTLEESIEYGKSNAKFIADVIVAGFEVYDTEWVLFRFLELDLFLQYAP